MTENGYYEPDVCIICGEKCYVSWKNGHKALLDHVIEYHLPNPKHWSSSWKCWCGFTSEGYDGRSLITTHLRLFVGDLNMTFPNSVDRLWAHYHAAMIGVTPEAKCESQK